MSKEDEDADELIQMLIDLGALEVHGYDKRSDSITYRITPRLREVMPELYKEHFSYLNEIAFKLWQEGLVEIRFNEAGSPTVLLIEGIDYESMLDVIDEDSRYFIENLINMNKLI
jgi:hypothetical protein